MWIGPRQDDEVAGLEHPVDLLADDKFAASCYHDVNAAQVLCWKAMFQGARNSR